MGTSRTSNMNLGNLTGRKSLRLKHAIETQGSYREDSVRDVAQLNGYDDGDDSKTGDLTLPEIRLWFKFDQHIKNKPE